MKVSELNGAQLDYWVGKAEELDVSICLDGRCALPIEHAPSDWGDGGWDYSPSTDWSQGGPIIDRERITFEDLDGNALRAVISREDEDALHWADGPTHLIAAMRVRIRRKYGDEVPDNPA